MRTQKTFDEIALQQWEKLAAEAGVASWFQTIEAYRFYASLPNVFVPFVVSVVREDGVLATSMPLLKGICVGYITQEPNPLKQFFTRRAIIYGGPLLADDATEEEVEALMRQVAETVGQKAIYLETRNFCDYAPWRKAFERAGFVYRPHYDMHIVCDTTEQMFARMQTGKRRQIKKAMEEGQHMVETTSEQEIHQFYELLHRLYQTKVKTPLYPELFFHTFVRDAVGKLLVVKHGNDIVGGMLCPIMHRGGENVMYEWFVVGEVMATWGAMQYASDHGITMLDLMGAGEPNVPYGIRDFKLSMGGTLKEYGRFVCIQSPVLYRLGVWGVKCFFS